MRPIFGLSVVHVVRDDRFLASNMAQTGESNDKRSARRSQRFTTGSNEGGYALDSVDLLAMTLVAGVSNPYRGWSVSVYTVDASGHPSTVHAALTARQDYRVGHNVFTAPAGTTLSADTTYTLVVTAGTTTVNSQGDTTTELDLEVTTSDGENERSASRWSIADAFDIESSSSWAADPGGKALYIAVRGAPQVVAPLGKPTALSAAANGTTRIDLSWTAPASDGGSAITGYRIEVSTDGATWTALVAITGSAATTYSNTGLSAGTTRHYRVSAINVNGTGPASDTASATTGKNHHEPAGADFSHDADTTAIVSVGTVSSGRMSYPADGDPWADYGDPGWGDMFKLDGLEARKTYRVEVDFNRVANTVGGSIQMYICCNHGPDPYAVSEWDSNYDGRAIFDFDTGWTVGATFVSVIPGNSMKPDVWEFGSYTVTLTDVTGLRRLVSNTRQRPTVVSYTLVGLVSGLNVQQATSFRTGSNPNGYMLDRVTAYIDRFPGGATGTAVPKVAIHSNATGDLPGTKLCDLQMLADYETGLSLSNGDWPDRLYAPDCADNTLAKTTTYWVVFSEGSSTLQTYFVGTTNSDSEDPRSAFGWSIGDDYYQKAGTGAWAVVIATNPLAIGVYGTPK